jgi:hypothetical protein
VSKQFGGLVAFACGDDGNIVVPHVSAEIRGPGVPTPTTSGQPSCGTLVFYAGQAHTFAEPDTTDDTTSPTACFAANWTTTCASQQLSFVQFTSQSVTKETFTIAIQHLSPCQRVLTRSAQSRTLTTPSSDITTITCAGLVQNATGLIISGCGTDPPLAIPAPSGMDARINPSPPQVGQVCAVTTINSGYRRCFWQAYQTCKPTTISAMFGGQPADVMESVTAQSLHGQCVLTAYAQFAEPFNAATLAETTVTATCTDARQQNNEIVVGGCGSLGDLIFP